MNIKEALDFGTKELSEAKIDRARLESEMLLSFVLKKDRIHLHSHSSDELCDFDFTSFKRLIKRRSLHEPVEYIIEKVGFFSKELYISHGALIPRPESEILVEKAFNLIKEKGIKNIAEIGVGSGAISVTLANITKDIPNLNFYATDISPEALFNAYMNKFIFNISNIALFNSSFLDFNAKKKIKIELLISNPPYIKNDFILPKNLQYEPKIALFGGENGDEILKKIITLAYEKEIPYLLCEMGSDQESSILEFMQNYPHKHLSFYNDLAGLKRGFFIEF